MRNTLAMNTSMFDGYSVDVWMRFTRALGLSYVEFAFNQGYAGQFSQDFFSRERAAALKQKLTEYSLNTVALGCTLDMGDTDTVEAFKQRILFAREIGARYLNTCTTNKAKRDQFFHNLDLILPFAEEHKVVIAIENGGDHAYDLFASAEDGINIIEKYSTQALSMNYDPGNLVSLCPYLSPSADCLLALPYCAHIHIKDVKVHDDCLTFVPIGEGVINYQKIFSALGDSEKAIPMSIEKPLHLIRKKDATPVRQNARVELKTLHTVIEKSIEYIQSSLV